MRSGTCPKCAQSSVYRSGEKRSFSYGDGGFFVHVGEWMVTPSTLEQYICSRCGYFESYILDPAKLQKVEAKWQKVG
ncbi:MAG: hypothetical protein ACOYOB_14760 [Myxococcota bacterium]